MNDLVYDNIEIAPVEVVKCAARDFASALAESPQFKTFEQAADRFRQDETAQHAMQAYQEKQQSLRALLMLNALNEEQRVELEGLHRAFINQPVVRKYFQAQTDLARLCQQLGDMLSECVGLNYAAACGVSCCG